MLGQGQELRLGDLWESGGFMMWPLGICLALGLLIIVWKFFDLALKSASNRKLFKEVDGLIAQQRLDQALSLCEESKSPAGNILSAGLRRYKEGTTRVTQAIENAGAIEVSKLERGLVWLATLSNVAPLLGFLGTVSGMINAFEAIAASEQVNAKLVASGISEALITTASGLIVAIPATILYNYFVSAIDRFVIEMEETSAELIEELERMKG